MRVFYADVYFLINFTTDFLALYLSCRFLSVPVRRMRLAMSAAAGSLFAVVAVLVSVFAVWKAAAAIAVLWGMMRLVSPDCTHRRRVRLTVGFLLTETLIGGMVYAGYGLLDRVADFAFFSAFAGAENRKILQFAVLLLFAIGILRFLTAVFEPAAHERSVGIRICFGGKSIFCEALVDSGNLCKDPLDGTPVVFLKAKKAAELFPTEFVERGIVRSDELRRAFRLIPLRKGRLLSGVRPSKLLIVTKKREENVRCVVAVDGEEGTYGGFEALLPAVLTDHVG